MKFVLSNVILAVLTFQSAQASAFRQPYYGAGSHLEIIIGHEDRSSEEAFYDARALREDEILTLLISHTVTKHYTQNGLVLLCQKTRLWKPLITSIELRKNYDGDVKSPLFRAFMSCFEAAVGLMSDNSPESRPLHDGLMNDLKNEEARQQESLRFMEQLQQANESYVAP